MNVPLPSPWDSADFAVTSSKAGVQFSPMLGANAASVCYSEIKFFAKTNTRNLLKSLFITSKNLALNLVNGNDFLCR